MIKNIDVNGEKAKVKVLKPKLKKRTRHARTTTLSCPNCLSTLKLNGQGLWECTRDKLIIWEKDFVKYHKMTPKQKISFLSKLTSTSRFEELYDYWKYSVETNQPEEFTCGYTNDIHLPIAQNKQRIPDPLFCKRIEKLLGRSLTEEEIYGDSPLYFYRGKVLTEYRKRAKEIKMIWIILPDEIEISI